MESTPSWVDWTFFGVAAILFLHALNDWVYAKPRTRRLAHSVVIMAGFTLMQVDDILPLPRAWRISLTLVTFAVFIWSVWYALSAERRSGEA